MGEDAGAGGVDGFPVPELHHPALSSLSPTTGDLGQKTGLGVRGGGDGLPSSDREKSGPEAAPGSGWVC